MRKHIVAVTLACAFALTGLDGGGDEVRAVAADQANCAGDLFSSMGTTNGRGTGILLSRSAQVTQGLGQGLAPQISDNCGDERPDEGKKSGPEDPA